MNKLNKNFESTFNIIDNIQIITAYEQKDKAYFYRLINQFKQKRKKYKFDVIDINLLNIYRAIISYNYEVIPKFLNVIMKEGNAQKTNQKYFVFWLVNKFPVLQNEAYSKFLEQCGFKHFEFKNVKQLKLR